MAMVTVVVQVLLIRGAGSSGPLRRAIICYHLLQPLHHIWPIYSQPAHSQSKARSSVLQCVLVVSEENGCEVDAKHLAAAVSDDASPNQIKMKRKLISSSSCRALLFEMCRR